MFMLIWSERSVSLWVELQGLSQIKLIITWWISNGSKGQLAGWFRNLVASGDNQSDSFTQRIYCTLVFAYFSSPPLGFGASCHSWTHPLTWDSARHIKVLKTYLLNLRVSEYQTAPNTKWFFMFLRRSPHQFFAQFVHFKGCRWNVQKFSCQN